MTTRPTHTSVGEALDRDPALRNGQRVFTLAQIQLVRKEIFFAAVLVFVACALFVFVGYRYSTEQALAFCATLHPDWAGPTSTLLTMPVTYAWLLPLCYCIYLHRLMRKVT